MGSQAPVREIIYAPVQLPKPNRVEEEEKKEQRETEKVER